MTRVLIVDDAVDVRQMLVVMIAASPGFEVVGEAGDGREGVRLATALQPDVVLLDLAMPVMDGLAALPLIRSACPRTAVLVFTGFAAVDLEHQARAKGAHGYLVKGASRREIMAAVAAVGPLPTRAATAEEA